MAYKVLSLKWRPQSFNDVVGQEHIITTLSNAIVQNRIAQGYIFTGPRGVGKTTTARILAMALNSTNGPNVNFDSQTTTSREIAEGRSIDVLEIDGASNRGIEDIRGLREQIKFSPMNGSYKIVIIDEVHMLTNQAFNALLRTLEEPPSHGKFIFATTDIHKVPATILSRCQRFDFNRIPVNIISDRMNYILKDEGIESDSESIYAIAKKADGSMRDALSLLEQAISFCNGKLDNKNVCKAIGLISQDLYFKFTDSIKNKDYNSMIELLTEFSMHGIPAFQILIGLKEHIRNIVYAGIDNGEYLLEFNDENKSSYIKESSRWDKKDLFRLNQVLIDTSAVIKRSHNPYLLLEMTLFKLLEMDSSVNINQLLKNVAGNQPIFTNEVIPTELDKLKKENRPTFKINNKNKNLENNDIPKEPNKKLNQIKIDKRIMDNKNLDKKFQLNIDDLNNIWPQIIEKINDEKPSVATILEDFKPWKIEHARIILLLDSSMGFNHDLLKIGLIMIEKQLQEKFNYKFNVDYEINRNENIQDKSKEVIDKDKFKNQDDEVFNRVVDLFDGEIIE